MATAFVEVLETSRASCYYSVEASVEEVSTEVVHNFHGHGGSVHGGFHGRKLPSTSMEASMETSTASMEASATSVKASTRFHGSGGSWKQWKLPWKLPRASMIKTNNAEDRGYQHVVIAASCQRVVLLLFPASPITTPECNLSVFMDLTTLITG